MFIFLFEFYLCCDTSKLRRITVFSFILKVKNFIIKHLYGIFALCALFVFFYPQYLRSLVYPYILGMPTEERLEISQYDSIKNVTFDSFLYENGHEPVILTPKATYRLTARILDLERYDTLFEKFYHGYDKERMLYNSIAPLDLVLGFSDMAKPEILKHYKFEHQWRGSIYKCNPCDGNAQAYMNNYHIIPGSFVLRKAFEMLMKNEPIYLEGYLVDVQAKNIPHFRLHTGLSHGSFHDDQLLGGQTTGMCFVLYVTKMVYKDRIYQ